MSTSKQPHLEVIQRPVGFDLRGYTTLGASDMSIRLPDDPTRTDSVIVYPCENQIVWVHGLGMASVAIAPGAAPCGFYARRYGFLRAWWNRLWYRPTFRWEMR